MSPLLRSGNTGATAGSLGSVLLGEAQARILLGEAQARTLFKQALTCAGASSAGMAITEGNITAAYHSLRDTKHLTDAAARNLIMIRDSTNYQQDQSTSKWS